MNDGDFMIKTKICPKCGMYYDETLSECPSCHEKNDVQAMHTEKKNVPLDLSLVRQAIAFGAGWLGLDVFATVILLVIRLIASLTFADAAQVTLYMQTIDVAMFTNFFAYFAIFGILLVVIFPVLKPLLGQFKKFRPLLLGLAYGVLILASSIAISVFYYEIGISSSDNANETAVVTMMQAFPLLSFIVFVIFGPVCEEITYRLGLFSGLRRFNKIMAYVVVILLFGLIHFNFKTTDWINELLNLPYYMTAGAILCYVYDKENLATSMVAHVTNNLISFVTTFISTTDVMTKIF
jgi:membrane protease YdiL (CAAX protease family)